MTILYLQLCYQKAMNFVEHHARIGNFVAKFVRHEMLMPMVSCHLVVILPCYQLSRRFTRPLMWLDRLAGGE